MTLESAAFSGFLVGLVAYSLLTAFFVYGWLRRISGRAALIASALTMLWFASVIGFGLSPVSDALELTMYAGWIALLARILGVGLSEFRLPEFRAQSALIGAAAALWLFGLATASRIVELPLLADGTLAKLLLCLVGTVTLEQVARNTRRDHQWNVKLLIIGLALLFVYGFVQNAETLLFRSRSLSLLVPHGFICAAATPFIAIAALRNREHRMNLNLSRSFVFRTGTLILAGTYLLIMGTAGYYVRFFGGQWGPVFEVFLVTAALLSLMVLAASTQVRNWLRVAIARNLYEYKYDYREEWLRVTAQLTEANPDAGLAERAMRTLTDLLYANAAGYFRMSEAGVLLPEVQIGARWNAPMTPEDSKTLSDFFAAREWVIDLDEWRESDGAYPGLRLRADVEQWSGVRFIVPLLLERHLFGAILIGQPAVSIKLIWEDYDILKVIARQAAAFLALHHADQVLAESRQLRAMDQLSAFVVHDLKTITAQFSLLLRNAERHKQNPAFIDDMLRTTDHAVTQMTRLLHQLRARDSDMVTAVDLVDVVRTVAAERGRQAPAPSTRIEAGSLVVHGDAGRLGSVIGHIVQNAQEASGESGSVCIGIHATATWAVLEISDNGHGMTPAFIESELFKPFATTKGVAGIGVGAFQCREYLRQLGGDVSVRSQPGVGTTFTLRIPLPETVEARA